MAASPSARQVFTLDELYASEESTGPDAPLEGLTITQTNFEWVADALVEDMLRVAASDAAAWEACKSKDGCTVDQDKSGELAISRGKLVYERPAGVMFEVFRSHDHLRLCDSRYKSSEVLETLSDECYISQMLYKFPMPLKDRAMVTFATERRLSADSQWSFVVCSSSAAHPAPLPRRHVRLFLQRSGYVITPLNADGSPAASDADAAASTRCLVTWVAQLDPRGKVPKKVSNMQSSAAFILVSVRNWLDRDAAAAAAYAQKAADAAA